MDYGINTLPVKKAIRIFGSMLCFFLFAFFLSFASTAWAGDYDDRCGPRTPEKRCILDGPNHGVCIGWEQKDCDGGYDDTIE